MSSVVSARFSFVVEVEALPLLWRGSVVFGEAQSGICCHVLCVSWVKRWILYIGGYFFLNEGECNMTLSFCLRFGCDYRGGRGCLRL